MTRRSAAPRRGFTLIEILIVVAIIAILASFLVVGIRRVTVTAKNTATIADIAQISNAVSTYKAKMNVGFIPSGGVVDLKLNPNGLFRLRPQYVGNEFEAIYLKQLFPQMDGCIGSGNTGLPTADLDANQTLVFFLTGGDVTNFQGFSTNRTAPFTAPAAGSNESRLGPFLDFPASRYALGSDVTGASKNASALLDRWGSPFAYFAFNPILNKYDLNQSFTFNGTTVQPYVVGNRVLNAKGFQIISAGDNGKDDTPPNGFGPGGTGWTPGQGAYAEGMAGADDLSNFNSGVLITAKE